MTTNKEETQTPAPLDPMKAELEWKPLSGLTIKSIGLPNLRAYAGWHGRRLVGVAVKVPIYQTEWVTTDEQVYDALYLGGSLGKYATAADAMQVVNIAYATAIENKQLAPLPMEP